MRISVMVTDFARDRNKFHGISRITPWNLQHIHNVQEEYGF